jgi:predicted metal-binding membrane protein
VTANALDAVLKRERGIIIAGLISITALAWLYIVMLAADMAPMGDMGAMSNQMSMPQMQAGRNTTELFLNFIMWAVMMVAMMIPSAAPMILAFSTINRKQASQNSIGTTTLFLVGYVLVWTSFSALATLAQWGLHSAALLSPMMTSNSPLLGGILLVSAGIFQFTPYKHACLGHCRTPIGFLLTEWREGNRGALVMGIRHGVFCVGCCWLIMTLLFVAGVMNLLWIAVLAVYILLEKIVPIGNWFSHAAGLLLIIWGISLMVGFI